MSETPITGTSPDPGPNDGIGPFDDAINTFSNDDPSEVQGHPHQQFEWEYNDTEDAEDEPPDEGTQEDGTRISYSKTSYFFNDLDSVVYRIRMRITNDPNFPDRNIDRYITYKAAGKYTANGQGTDRDLFEKGESHDDMEYFMRRLRAAERDYSSTYVSPVT